VSKSYNTIRVEKEGGITWVIFNRPDKRNAMSPELHFEMEDALEELALDTETKVLIITGAGKAFSAGQDLKTYFRETANDPKLKSKAQKASNQWRWHKLSTFPKPTIAMVNGFCFGGAFTQLCACDIAIAADEATFGLSEVNWGIIPGGVVSWNVARNPELPRRAVLRHDRPAVRRQEGGGNPAGELFRAGRQAARRDH
jgi:trans-feruloyl-CoA hydratase/vanillin synthase